MKQLAILLVGLSIFFCSCSSQNSKTINSFSGKDIYEFVNKAVNGDEHANTKLSHLFDYNLPLPLKVNKVLIDSARTHSGSVIYIVLVEHENPLYNRMAAFSKELHLLLLDKSLNGYLSLNHVDAGQESFIRINEQFLSKDIIRLERVTLYNIDTVSSLCFRSFTKFSANNREYKQNIEEITSQGIKTTIMAPAGSGIKGKTDTFLYDETLKMFRSSSDLFNKFVIKEISSLNTEIEKPQITDVKSAMESVGITSDDVSDTLLNTSNFGVGGFGLTLSETWKELRNVSISAYINKEVKGTRYINNNYGSSIYVIPLSVQDSAEMYINTVLDQTSEGRYKVRYGNKIESGKYFIQYFEYACGSKKFLLILETSKYTYEKLREMFTNIISSFYVEC